jgi:hypothetical protein
MQTLITNKANWSNEECEVVINDDGTFTIGMEYTFKMEIDKVDTDGKFELSLCHVLCLEEDRWSWRGFFFDGEWTFSDYVERSDSNPYLAFAKLAWNIIQKENEMKTEREKTLETLAKELLECLNDEMKYHGKSEMAEQTLETIDRAIDILYGGE